FCGVFFNDAVHARSHTRRAGTGINVNTGGTAWTNLGNVTANYNNEAYVFLYSDGSNSRSLRGYNYGFTIPVGVTITGIEVAVEKRRANASSSNFGNIRDLSIRLRRGAFLVGDDKAQDVNWASSWEVVTYGSPTDLWGATWTPEQINDADFGVYLSARKVSTGNRYADVDYMQITVYYTNPTPTITNFNPTSACAGSNTNVVITGANFTGTTAV